MNFKRTKRHPWRIWREERKQRNDVIIISKVKEKEGTVKGLSG